MTFLSALKLYFIIVIVTINIHANIWYTANIETTSEGRS